MLSNVMESSALFRPFSKSDRRTVIEKFRAREVKQGDVVIHEGQRSDGLYVVLAGELEVRRQDQVLAQLKEGELFGEMSLLEKTAANASVRALKRTSLLRLPREAFDALILSHPQILMLVSELTEDRRRRNQALSALAPVGLAAVAVGEEPVVLV
jgi:CRP-like cAMP-binding protein